MGKGVTSLPQDVAGDGYCWWYLKAAATQASPAQASSGHGSPGERCLETGTGAKDSDAGIGHAVENQVVLVPIDLDLDAAHELAERMGHPYGEVEDLPRFADVLELAGAPFDRVELAGADLRLAGCNLHKNWQLAGTGAGGAVLGSPLTALVWLANTLGERGVVLQPGQVILPGSVTAAIPVGAGDTVTATFAGLGSVTARFTGEAGNPEEDK